MAGVNSPPERVTQLREQLGLNRPLIAQYFDWMSALARGDFGTSILTGRSVTSLVGARASITFPLIILALLIALAIGLPLGCAAVLARSATVRAVFHVLAIVGGAVPALWGGLLLILLFGRGVGLLDVFPRKGSRWMVGAHPVRRYQRWYCRLYRSASSWEHRLCDTRARP